MHSILELCKAFDRKSAPLGGSPSDAFSTNSSSMYAWHVLAHAHVPCRCVKSYDREVRKEVCGTTTSEAVPGESITRQRNEESKLAQTN